MNLKLKKFNMKQIPPGSICVFIAKRKSGKSWLVRDYLYHHKDTPVGTVISPTENANTFYGDFIPKIFIHDEYTPELLARYVKRQKTVAKMVKDEIKQYGETRIDPRSFLILDDTLYDKSWIKDKNIRYCFFNGRHVHTALLITSQDSLGMPPSYRGNIDFTFILKQPLYNQRKRLYEHYCSMFPTFEMFCKTLDQCTENHECMVIDNTVNSNKIEDMVFWYRAEEHENFRVGAPQFWQYNDQFLDEESENEDDFDINSFQKKNSVPLTVKKLD